MKFQGHPKIAIRITHGQIRFIASYCITLTKIYRLGHLKYTWTNLLASRPQVNGNFVVGEGVRNNYWETIKTGITKPERLPVSDV